MNEEKKTIINPNMHLFMLEFQEHVQLGWELDPINGPKMWGFAYETGLTRSDKTIAAAIQKLEDGPKPVVMSRGETLQLAREAKRLKREGQHAAVN